MNSIAQTLQERIKEIENPIKFSLRQSFINSDLSPNEKLSLTQELLRLWFSKDYQTCRLVFGKIYDPSKKERAYATLTGDKKELRVWYDKTPGYLGLNHVDGFTEAGLLEIRGTEISQYVNIIEGIIAPAFKIPNGGAIFARRKDNLPFYYQTNWNKPLVEIDYSRFIELKGGNE